MTQDELKLKLNTHEVMILPCYTILGIQELQFLLKNHIGEHPHEKQSTKNVDSMSVLIFLPHLQSLSSKVTLIYVYTY